MTYVPGDYKMVCERCGGVYLHSEMREEWTGAWVCTRGCFESRHPQDFVEGREDNQTVPVARPAIPQTMGSTTLNGAVAQYATACTLTSVTGLAENDPIGVVLDDATIHWTFIYALAGAVVTMGSHIPGAASSGNTVYLPSINSESWQS
jgi:hypothetical protein